MAANRNIGLITTRYILIDLVGDIVYFPVWWYSAGLKRIVLILYGSLRSTARNLSLRLLVLNILKPMFGQYDRSGRIISFFMRFVILIGRLIYIVIDGLFLILLLAAWLGLPLLIIYRLSNFLTFAL